MGGTVGPPGGQCGTLPKDDQLECKTEERSLAQAAADVRDAQLKYIASGQPERDEELDELKSRGSTIGDRTELAPNFWHASAPKEPSPLLSLTVRGSWRQRVF
jgi:hypothetical protein